MSARRAATPWAGLAWRPLGFRALALAGASVLTLATLAVLVHVVDVAGGAGGIGRLAVVVVGSLAAAAVAARTLRPRWAVLLGAGLLAAGLAGYLQSVPAIPIDGGKQLRDTAALLSGMSVLRMTNAGLWAIGFAPGPILVTWYFLLRRRYGAGVLVGGAALAVFVLTGDLETVPALVGVLGGVAAVGFGRVEREGDHPAVRNGLLVVLVAMLVVTTSASVVPGGAARPLVDEGGSTTVEASLTATDARVEVLGAISLSPAARFTVDSPSAEYWRVAGYDRYTGAGWVRTGPDRAYAADLSPPPADDAGRLSQSFRAESETDVMPAAWRPVGFESSDASARVTDLGGLRPAGSLEAGDTYTVESVVPEPSAEDLRRAGTDYPDAVEARYLGLPGSTPDRLGRFTANLTADAETPLDAALTVERWLEAEKTYSLDVERPDGDVASSFVFEMSAGYCTYYATAMVAMLRTQGIPARFVTGYLPGQPVGDRDWVVRGYDSHAWVEVYFPDVGWVRFDPTPAAPRARSEADSLESARSSGQSGVDTEQSRSVSAEAGRLPADQFPTYGFVDPNASFGPDGDAAAIPGRDSPGAGTGAAGGGDTGPDPEAVLYGLVLLLGAVTAGVSLGIPGRLYRELWVRRLPDGPPRRRVEGAVDRAEYLLGRQYRPRRPDETRRAYVEALRGAGATDRAARLFALGERATFAGEASAGDARTAARLLEDIRAETARVG